MPKVFLEVSKKDFTEVVQRTRYPKGPSQPHTKRP